MGKTAGGAIWLNAERLSPYDFWQFWRNTEDADVGRFLRFFTELPLHEIELLENMQGVDLNNAKKILADEATKMCHGEQAAKEARQKAESTFEQGKPEAFPMSVGQLEKGIPLIDFLVNEIKWASSKSEARRLILGKGIRINDEIIDDEKFAINLNIVGEGCKLSSGKKKHILIKADHRNDSVRSAVSRSVEKQKFQEE
jgi:tyrosyl-tRNA synthetase